MTSFKLLISRRFGTMFSCMALGAFNDNFYKNALIIMTTRSEEHTSELQSRV
jgi:hypothetical protein